MSIAILEPLSLLVFCYLARRGRAATNILARAKRYERMMKAHGIAPNAASVRSSSAIPRAPKVVANKKRKADQFAEERAITDDDEGLGLDNIKSEVKHENRMMLKEEVMQHQIYSPGNMGEELGLDLMSVKEEPMSRAYDDQGLNQYVLSNGETLFSTNGLDVMNGSRHASHYGDLEVSPRDGNSMNSYFANMEHAYGVPAQDAYGLGSFEGEELIMVDSHGRPA